MRVVCPHAGAVHPATLAALDLSPWEVEFRDVSHSDIAYADLLCELWADADTFCIVEHDIVPHPWALAELAMCPEPYCAFPYPWTQAVGPALGCTRFSSHFMRVYPDAAEIAARIPSPRGKPGHWGTLDVWLQGAVLRDLYHWQPHTHLPAVRHENPARQLPAELADQPIRIGIEGRMWLEPGLVEGIAGEVAAIRMRQASLGTEAISDSTCKHHPGHKER